MRIGLIVLRERIRSHVRLTLWGAGYTLHRFVRRTFHVCGNCWGPMPRYNWDCCSGRCRVQMLSTLKGQGLSWGSRVRNLVRGRSLRGERA